MAGWRLAARLAQVSHPDSGGESLKPKARLGLIVILAAAIAGCGPAARPPGATTALTAAPARVELTVFAAASLTDALNALKADFEALYPHVTVVYNFGGSNALAQQVVEGAPADVFASANNAQMNVAIEGGRIVTGTQRTFVRNRLVVVVPTGNPGEVETLQDLARPGLLLVLAAAEVPVGQYSLDFLDKAAQDPAFGAAFKDEVLANVVSYEENVRTVLTKILLGEGDAGIVYTSDITGEGADQVERLDIPDALNTIASYPIAPIADSENAEMAQAFVDYTLAAEGQRTLAEFGFIPAADPSGAGEWRPFALLGVLR
jgi:molybdate transport system substrate-binding protein